MKTIIRISILLFLVYPVMLSAAERVLPEKYQVKKLSIKFNGDSINSYYLLLDARTQEEKAENKKTKKLNGTVHVFMHGHAQRPDDAGALTSLIAMESKSGFRCPHM